MDDESHGDVMIKAARFLGKYHAEMRIARMKWQNAHRQKAYDAAYYGEKDK